MQYPGII